MNFLSYILLFMIGSCVLTFGVLGLFVNRFLKLLSPICKSAQPYMHATDKSHSKSSRKVFFNKKNVEDAYFEEMN